MIIGINWNLNWKLKLKKPERYEVNFVEFQEPTSLQKAVSRPDGKLWTKAINEELEAHEHNETWTITPYQGQKPIDSKWVFKIQNKGAHSKYKARLCARGFTKRAGLDFHETFSPVVRYDSVRVILALVTKMDYDMLQFDVKTAFLYDKVEENLYMSIPEGLKVKVDRNKYVCKLNKSSYGLKQAPQSWNQTFVNFLSKFELKETDADACVFYRKRNENNVIILALFIDDGLLVGRNRETLKEIVKEMQQAFTVKVMEVENFCGMEIARNRAAGKMYVHQRNYARKVVMRFNQQEAKTLAIPADPNVKLVAPDESAESVQFPFREAVGSLLFLATVSRPDIAFSVNSVSKFLNNYSAEHCYAVKRIIRYVSGTIEYGIMYSRIIESDKIDLIGYSDADFAGDNETRRSTTGYINFYDE